MELEEITLREYISEEVFKEEKYLIKKKEYDFLEALHYELYPSWFSDIFFSKIGQADYGSDIELEIKGNSITKLVIGDVSVPALPESCTDLEMLEKLSLCNTGLERIPDNLDQLKHLKFLEIYGSRFSSFPESICRLKGLEELDIVACQFGELPEALIELENLKELYLSLNNLVSVPEFVYDFKNLEKLYIDYTLLEEISPNIGKLSKLKELSLAGNYFSRLPESMGQLKNLEKLIIYSTNLKNLPESFANLTNLKELDIKNSQLMQLPDSIIGNDAIIDAISDSSCFKDKLFSSAKDYFEKKRAEIKSVFDLAFDGQIIAEKMLDPLLSHKNISREIISPAIIGVMIEKNEKNKNCLMKLSKEIYSDKISSGFSLML